MRESNKSFLYVTNSLRILWYIILISITTPAIYKDLSLLKFNCKTCRLHSKSSRWIQKWECCNFYQIQCQWKDWFTMQTKILQRLACISEFKVETIIWKPCRIHREKRPNHFNHYYSNSKTMNWRKCTTKWVVHSKDFISYKEISPLVTHTIAWLGMPFWFYQNSWIRWLYNFSRYILGIGDRHPDNFLISLKSGKSIAIDFG